MKIYTFQEYPQKERTEIHNRPPSLKKSHITGAKVYKMGRTTKKNHLKMFKNGHFHEAIICLVIGELKTSHAREAGPKFGRIEQ